MTTGRSLTRRQTAVHEHLLARRAAGDPPPTLDELCVALGLSSRGSLHLHVSALVDAGLVEPMNGRQRGVRLCEPAESVPTQLPLLGAIVAGHPLEAVSAPEFIDVPQRLHTARECFVLRVKGSSMMEAGILDDDWVVIERRDHAGNGEVVVALIDDCEATLKRIEQRPGETVLHPANAGMAPIRLAPDRVKIQGVVVGQMRSYRH